MKRSVATHPQSPIAPAETLMHRERWFAEQHQLVAANRRELAESKQESNNAPLALSWQHQLRLAGPEPPEAVKAEATD